MRKRKKEMTSACCHWKLVTPGAKFSTITRFSATSLLGKRIDHHSCQLIPSSMILSPEHLINHLGELGKLSEPGPHPKATEPESLGMESCH